MNRPINTKAAIVAGSFKIAANVARERGFLRDEWIYVDDRYKSMGWHPAVVVFGHNWQQVDGIEEILMFFADSSRVFHGATAA